MPTAVYHQKTRAMTGLTKVIKRLNGSESPATVASALEFILEGLHLNKKLNKKVVEGEISYWG
jgi:magnesium chelatase subunit I